MSLKHASGKKILGDNNGYSGFEVRRLGALLTGVQLNTRGSSSSVLHVEYLQRCHVRRNSPFATLHFDAFR